MDQMLAPAPCIHPAHHTHLDLMKNDSDSDVEIEQVERANVVQFILWFQQLQFNLRVTPLRTQANNNKLHRPL